MLSKTWRERAACRGIDTDVFFDVDGVFTLERLNKAKSICSDCEVQDDCLMYAVDNNIVAGIYGGMTRKNRLAIRKASKRERV